MWTSIVGEPRSQTRDLGHPTFGVNLQNLLHTQLRGNSLIRVNN
jgi:hypothetical protein